MQVLARQIFNLEVSRYDEVPVTVARWRRIHQHLRIAEVDAPVCLPRRASVCGAFMKQAIVAGVPTKDVMIAVPIDTCGRPEAHRHPFYEAVVAPV